MLPEVGVGLESPAGPWVDVCHWMNNVPVHVASGVGICKLQSGPSHGIESALGRGATRHARLHETSGMGNVNP